MAEFFLGRREVGHFVERMHKDKVSVECRIFERWKEIDVTIARCGHPISFEVEKHVGFSKKDIHSLEGGLKAALGIKGFAQLESSIKSSISSEVTWSILEVRKKSFTCIPPNCGSCTSIIYQKVRDYDLVCRDARLFRQGYQLSLEEYTHYHDQRPNRVPNDPICQCKTPVEPEFHGLFNVDMGKVSMQVPFSRIEGGMLLDFDGQKVRMNEALAGSFSAQIPRELLPEVVVFLGDLEGEHVEARFIPYQEPQYLGAVEVAQPVAVRVEAVAATAE